MTISPKYVFPAVPPIKDISPSMPYIARIVSPLPVLSHNTADTPRLVVGALFDTSVRDVAGF